MVKDPVCGMDVDPETAPGVSEYNGKKYYFCSLSCKLEFDRNPDKFIDATQTTKGH